MESTNKIEFLDIMVNLIDLKMLFTSEMFKKVQKQETVSVSDSDGIFPAIAAETKSFCLTNSHAQLRQ